MGMFDKELEGLEGKERQKERKRLHIKKSRAESEKTGSKRCKVTVLLEPTPKQGEYLRYYADCSTWLYEFMVNVWKNGGSPPKPKTDFWNPHRADFFRKRQEIANLTKCPSCIFTWVFNELRFSSTRKGGLESNVMKDRFGLEWSNCHLVVKHIWLTGMASSEWIEIVDSSAIPRGLVKSAKVFYKDECWYITFSIDPRIETSEQNIAAWDQRKSASAAWFHCLTKK